jgi:phenylacetate-CoA ligase
VSAYTTLASALLFPVHELLKRHDTTRIRRALEVSQWLEPEALRAAQLQRLRTFLQDIAQGVPYYRELFARERFEPAGLQSVADLAALPALTKPIIRTRYDDLKHREARALGR